MTVFDQTKLEKCEEILRMLVSRDTSQPLGDEKVLTDCIDALFGDEVKKMWFLHGENRASLVLKFSGKEENGGIAFVGHLDTVPFGKTESWFHDPLGAVVEDGIMYGRGTADMKGGVCAMLMAALHLQESRLELNKPVYFCFTADEEQGGIGIREIVGSGVLDHIDSAVISEPGSNKIGLGEKGALWIRVIGKGMAAHGSNPEIGTNALDCLIEIKESLESYIRQGKRHALLGNNTISLTKLEGGTGMNVIPGNGVMEMDIRTIPGSNHQDIIDFVEAACQKMQIEKKNFEYEIQILNNRVPVCNQGENQLAHEFQNIARAMGIEAEYTWLYCYTDISMMIPPLDIPFIVFGPGEAEQAHKIDEHIDLQSVKKYSDIYITYLLNYYGGIV